VGRERDEITVAGAKSAGISEHRRERAVPMEGPRSLYGSTKLAAELMVEEYADAYGLGFIINRLGVDGSVSDGEVGSRSSRALDGGALFCPAAGIYRVRRDGEAGPRTFCTSTIFASWCWMKWRNFSLYEGGRF